MPEASSTQRHRLCSYTAKAPPRSTTGALTAATAADPPLAARPTMGLGCSKRQSEDGGGDRGPTIVRLSPFRPRRCSSLRRSRSGPTAADGSTDADALGSPHSLLSLAADAAAASLARQPGAALAALPADLSQLLLERLVAQGLLDDGAVACLSGHALHFYRLPLAACPETVRPAWLAALTSASLEEADLSKTGVSEPSFERALSEL